MNLPYIQSSELNKPQWWFQTKMPVLSLQQVRGGWVHGSVNASTNFVSRVGSLVFPSLQFLTPAETALWPQDARGRSEHTCPESWRRLLALVPALRGAWLLGTQGPAPGPYTALGPGLYNWSGPQNRPNYGLLFLSLLVICPSMPLVLQFFFISGYGGERPTEVMGQVWFFNFATRLRSKLVLQKALLHLVIKWFWANHVIFLDLFSHRIRLDCHSLR